MAQMGRVKTAAEEGNAPASTRTLNHGNMVPRGKLC
jgi:hypothetical protein